MAEYIKRDAVIDLITRRYENPEICTAEINMIPAADVAPVVHGRWVMLGKRATVFKCSACNKVDPYIYGYCPNCGAKMDGGVDRAAD